MSRKSDKNQTTTLPSPFACMTFMISALRECEPNAYWLVATAAATSAHMLGQGHTAASKSFLGRAFSGAASEFPVIPHQGSNREPKP